jgi:polysaccharide export outer membrane protein
LNTSQKVRRDGRTTLPLVGEVVVAGLTPKELETALLALYDKQLVTKEVSVSITSSSYTFYVNGAVLRAGKQISDRSLTALEAIMEAGGLSES